MNNCDNQTRGDLPSPSWCPSIVEDDNARVRIMGGDDARIDNERDGDNNHRSPTINFHDPIYAAVLNEFNTVPPVVAARLNDDLSSQPIPELVKMEISDCSPDEICEETIVPCVVSGDKGAFITKMNSGGVEFVETIWSPDVDGTDSIASSAPDRGCGPMIFHTARAVAVPTSINVGEYVLSEEETMRINSKKQKAADTKLVPSRRPECEKSATSTTTSVTSQSSLRTPLTADSGFGPATSTHSVPSPWEFPSGGANLNEKPRNRSSHSSGIASLASSSTSSSGSEMAPKDVMISYSHLDRDMMKKIKARLEEAGISVWVDSTGLRSGVDFLSKIGQAIIDAKLFVSLVSTRSLQSKFCRDELSLAYISDKFLFPVALQTLDTLVPVMDTGLKLVLTRLEWTLLYEERDFDKRMTDLVLRMKNRIEQKTSERSIDTLSVRAPPASRPPPASVPTGADRRESFQSMSRLRRTKKPLNRQHSMYKTASTPQLDLSDASYPSLRDSWGVCSISLTPSLEENTAVLFFWERNFDGAESVSWNKFRGEILNQYGEELDKAYDKKEQQWMLEILYKELVNDDEDDTIPGGTAKNDDQLVLKTKYEEYCKVDGVMHPFWLRLQDQAVEKLAMKAVFGMESYPAYRLKAVENLSKFKSVAVFDALVELLDDDDPNVRAIAAISVSKCGSEGSSAAAGAGFEDIDDTLLKLLLEDKDRLVRESVCIAFGYRRNPKMIPHLVRVWRNDNISSVRDAAQVALGRIGGDEADRAIQMTKILQDEMITLMELQLSA